jgi:DNA-directed RNA polymerase alpha subunit
MMQIIQKNPEKLVLRTNISFSLANAIRRSVEEISTLAIDDVEIFKNDSALYDEFLSHRLGLIPLKTDNKITSKTSINFKLKKTGPCVVYSGDLKGTVKIVYDDIPLTILERGQDIELVATAKLGKGIEHTKHVPGLFWYRYILEVPVGNSKIDKIVQNSRSAMRAEKKGSKWVCDLSEADVDEILKIDKNAVRDTEEILLYIESWGQLDAENILKKATEALGTNLEEFEKSLK